VAFPNLILGGQGYHPKDKTSRKQVSSAWVNADGLSFTGPMEAFFHPLLRQAFWRPASALTSLPRGAVFAHGDIPLC